MDRWMKEAKDPGSESLEVYALEAEDQLRSIRKPGASDAYRKNTELYKQWDREGK